MERTESILEQIPEFVDKLFAEIKKCNIDITAYEMDHVCYRVETAEEYRTHFNYLSTIGELLVEHPIGGRPIATFKLHKGVSLPKHNRTVFLIELPMPKPTTFYNSGWEHAEFVVPDMDLNEFAKQYPDINWNRSGMNKDFNQDICIDLDKSVDNRLTVKFHNLSLETVIEIEKRQEVETH
jgi:predicted metalloenzyme YecM